MTIEVLSQGISSADAESFSFLVDYDTVAQTIGLTCTGAGHARLAVLNTQTPASTTVATASGGVDVATFDGKGVLNVGSTSGFSPIGGQATVATSTGTAVVSYTALGARSLTGVRLVSGSGLLTRGGAVTSPHSYLGAGWADQYGTTAGPVAPVGSTDADGVPNAGESAGPVNYSGQRVIVLGPGATGVDVLGQPFSTGAVSAAVVGQFNVPKGQTPGLEIDLSWGP